MLETLKALGITVPCKRVQTPEAAEITAAELGWPVWVSAGPLWRMRVENPGDLPLAWAKAKKYVSSPDAGVLLQADTPGERYRIVGYKLGRPFFPVDILYEWLSGTMFGVPMGFCIPAGLDAAWYSRLVELSKHAGAALPQGGYYVEMEFAVSPDALWLAAVDFPKTPGTALAQLMYRAQGIEIEADARRAALLEWPRSAPKRDLAAAVCWLNGHSGVVERITGAEAARAIPGVREVVIPVRPGDMAGHVTDIPSRDRLGYLLATAPVRAQALASARTGAGKISINTKTALD